MVFFIHHMRAIGATPLSWQRDRKCGTGEIKELRGENYGQEMCETEREREREIEVCKSVTRDEGVSRTNWILQQLVLTQHTSLKSLA